MYYTTSIYIQDITGYSTVLYTTLQGIYNYKYCTGHRHQVPARECQGVPACPLWVCRELIACPRMSDLPSGYEKHTDVRDAILLCAVPVKSSGGQMSGECSDAHDPTAPSALCARRVSIWARWRPPDSTYTT